MGNNKFCADHDELVKIEFAFLSESERCKNTLSNLKKAWGTLKSGDWVGESAEIFYTEMDSLVLPAMQRLVDAFAQAAKTIRDINQIFAEADKDVAALWKNDEQKGSNKLARVEPPGGSAVTPTPTPTRTPVSTQTPTPTSTPTPTPYHPMNSLGELGRELFLRTQSTGKPLSQQQAKQFVATFSNTAAGKALLALEPDLLRKIQVRVL